MYKRVIYESWTDWIPLIVTCLLVAVFLVVAISAMCASRKQMDKMAALPLEDNEPEDKDGQRE